LYKNSEEAKMISLRSSIILPILLLLGTLLSPQAFAQEESKTYSGDFWTRSTLTGDWGGDRNYLVSKGVTFDMSLTQTGMSVIKGGKNQGWEYAGRGDLTLNIDTQKLGLWPGGFFIVEVEGNYNRSINLDPGAISPVNTNQIFPMTGHQELNIPNLSFMQFFSHNIGIYVGKVATITSTAGDMNEFAHGKGDTQFFNTAFNVNPALLATVPYSTLGAGVIILPTKNPAEAIITVNALDGSGTSESSGFETVFESNTVYTIEGRVRTDLLGMTGHQLVGATYSTKQFTSLEQDSLLLIKGIVQNGKLNTEKKEHSWCAYYNFDQYLFEPKKGQGIGVFGRFGISDGNPNPVHHFYSLGFSGKGIVPGRALDSLGVGYYYMDMSNPKLTGLFIHKEFLRDEYGFEGYYNFAITPWMKLTPDVQFIRPAQKEKVSVSSVIPPVIKKEDIGMATVFGLRLQLIF
jgi:porin